MSGQGPCEADGGEHKALSSGQPGTTKHCPVPTPSCRGHEVAQKALGDGVWVEPDHSQAPFLGSCDPAVPLTLTWVLTIQLH